MPKPIKRQQWNNIDVFGLVNGISTWDPQYRTLQYVRSPIDTNLSLRDRIFRKNNNQPGLSKQGLLNGLCNEFSYDPYNVTSANLFQLTNFPFPSGNIGTQDIWVEYRDVNSTGSWSSLSQIWSEDYAEAKLSKDGFIVWQNEKYINISGVKNFNYSKTLEIMEDLPDNQELRISYYVKGTDQDNNLVLNKFTDMDNLVNPYDRYYVYKKPNEIDLLSGVTVYTLQDIPTGIYNRYYREDGFPLESLYTIRDHLKRKYQHTWNEIADASIIWDVHKHYGSGNIGHFYDASIPQNTSWCYSSGMTYTGYFFGFQGGIDSMSQALYLDKIIESGDAQNWFFTLYPGRFYLEGTPFYLFENPSHENIVFISGQANIPSGLLRGSHVILALSGYYYEGCVAPDEYLSGFVYEDHSYPVGNNGDDVWSYIYRRRPFVPSGVGYTINLDLGEYNIDFENGKIYANVLDSGAEIIWENNLVPSGRVIQYDINPLNDDLLNLQKFFIYLVNKEN